MMMKIVQNHTSVCTVTDNAGNFLGNIVRQKGSTLWSLRKAGVCRPFKRNIPSLTQAKKLVLDHPEMFTDPVWDWRESTLNAMSYSALWIGLIMIGTWLAQGAFHVSN